MLIHYIFFLLFFLKTCVTSYKLLNLVFFISSTLNEYGTMHLLLIFPSESVSSPKQITNSKFVIPMLYLKVIAYDLIPILDMTLSLQISCHASCHIDIIAIAKPQIVVLLYVQLQCFLRLENDRFSKKSTDYA